MGLRDRLALLRSGDRLTLGTVLDRLQPIHGPRRLVQEADDGLTLTFSEGADRTARLSAGIAERIEPGDRVVIATRNGYGLFLACVAANRAGGVAVPVNPKMSE